LGGGAYITARSTPHVASNSNSEPPEMLIDSAEPSTSASKEQAHRSSREDIQSVPKARPKKSRNANKKKRTTAILTDTPIKNSLQKTTVHVLEQMRKTGPKKRGRRSVCNISNERFTKETPKIIKKSKNA